MNMKKLLCVTLSGALTIGILASCGQKASDSDEIKENTSQSESVSDPDATAYIPDEVPSKFKATNDNITDKTEGGVEVAVDARDGEERYNFESEDLGFVDTRSGALLKIGMSSDEIESLIGSPRVIDLDYRIYDSIVIQYNDDMKAIKLIVASGNMEGNDDPTRFVSPRGIKISSSLDEFKSVYGDEYFESNIDTDDDTSSMNGSTRAIRYYSQDGDTYTYLGQSYTKDNKPENDSDLIMQTFLFEPGTNNVSVITVQTGESI